MMTKPKTYRALRHDIVRAKQAANAPEVHHPDAKREQIQRVLPAHCTDLAILELFGGYGNTTVVYAQYGDVRTIEHKARVYNALCARMCASGARGHRFESPAVRMGAIL